MMANRRSALRSVLAPLALAATLAAVTSACSQRVIPPPTPAPTPRPTPAPAPPPQRPASGDWRDTPVTPGNWTWGLESGQSVARFAGGTLVLRCDRSAGTITLQRAGSTTGPEPLTVTTSSGARTVSAGALPGGGIGLALSPRDPLLDMMAFSRGRFVIETPGQASLIVPSWPEVSRVIEDCR